jgi:hypothetical protein
MKRLAITVLFDGFLYVLMYLAIVNNSLQAEYLLSFMIITLGAVVTLTALTATDSVYQNIIVVNKYQQTNVKYSNYAIFSTLVEVCIFASQGWLLMAALWFGGAVFSIKLRIMTNKLK